MSRVRRLALGGVLLVVALAARGQGEDELSLARPGCRPVSPASQAAAVATFEGHFGPSAGVDASIDVNGDGQCDLIISYEPVGDPDSAAISEFYIAPGQRDGAVSPGFWQPSGEGVLPQVVSLNGSPYPFLATRRRGIGQVLLSRWNPQAPPQDQSPFAAIGVSVGEVESVPDTDPLSKLVRRFLSRGQLQAGLQALDSEDFVGAVSALNEAAAIDPAGPEITYSLGLAHYSAGRFGDAGGLRGASFYFDRSLRQGLAIKNPALAAAAHFNRAKSLQATGDNQGAQAEFQAYTVLVPDKRVQMRFDAPPAVSKRMLLQAARATARPRLPPGIRLGSTRETPLAAFLRPQDVNTRVVRVNTQTLVRGDLFAEGVRQRRPLNAQQLDQLTAEKLSNPRMHESVLIQRRVMMQPMVPHNP